MKKQIMSIAAAAALLTTGAMAFDSHTDGEIATDASGVIVKSSYTLGQAGVALTPIKKSSTQKGDALIYPYFTTEGGYSSEVVVRNTSQDAVVAKVVFYSGNDSKELRDFNIYLSGHDVFRFTIEQNPTTKKSIITSHDGSVIKAGVLERNVKVIDVNSTADDYTGLKFASENDPFTATLSENRGYIAIFGMVQSNGYPGEINGDDSILAFHNKHADLYAGYASLLDKERGTDWRYWRNADNLLNPNYMVGSMFTGDANVTAPNVILGDEGATTWKQGTADRRADFTGVGNVLTGQINIKNITNANDLLLNATAIEGFSDENKVVLWSTGEYASIADRCIEHTNNTAKYNVQCVKDDAKAFEVTSATYTYANHGNLDSADNRIYITQPYKRTLLQLTKEDTDGYTFKATATNTSVETGAKSFFQTKAFVYDENEKTPAKPVTTTTRSPINIVGAGLSGADIGSSPAPVAPPEPSGYIRELEMLNSKAFELNDELKDTYGKGNGFATFKVNVPAIITQMVATKVGNSLETNWVYSDTVIPTP